MPTITATSSSTSISSSSYSSSSSSSSATFVVQVPQGKNPFIQSYTLPSELVFIVVGAVLGAFFISILLARMIIWYRSSNKAKKAHPFIVNTLPDPDPSLFHDKKSIAPSIYSLNSSSTINVLGSASTEDLLVNSGAQGRSYRTALARASRSSLFISPTEMIALADYDKPDNSYLNWDNSPIESPQTANFTSQSTPSTLDPEKDPGTITGHMWKTTGTPKRPPSVHMEMMFDDDLKDFITTSDSSESSSIEDLNEKV